MSSIDDYELDLKKIKKVKGRKHSAVLELIPSKYLNNENSNDFSKIEDNYKSEYVNLQNLMQNLHMDLIQTRQDNEKMKDELIKHKKERKRHNSSLIGLLKPDGSSTLKELENLEKSINEITIKTNSLNQSTSHSVDKKLGRKEKVSIKKNLKSLLNDESDDNKFLIKNNNEDKDKFQIDFSKATNPTIIIEDIEDIEVLEDSSPRKRNISEITKEKKNFTLINPIETPKSNRTPIDQELNKQKEESCKILMEEIKNFTSKLNVLTTDNENINLKIDDLNKNNSELLEDNSNLEEKISKRIEKFEKEMLIVQEHLKEVEGQKEELSTKYKKSLDEIFLLENNVFEQSKSDKTIKASKTNKDLESIKRKFEKEIFSINTDITKKELKLNDLNVLDNKTSTELYSKSDELKQLMEESNELEIKIKELKQMHEDIKNTKFKQKKIKGEVYSFLDEYTDFERTLKRKVTTKQFEL